MIALDQWRRELKVVYDDDRGEKRKVSVISRNDSRDTLLSTKIPGLDKNLEVFVESRNLSGQKRIPRIIS